MKKVAQVRRRATTKAPAPAAETVPPESGARERRADDAAPQTWKVVPCPVTLSDYHRVDDVIDDARLGISTADAEQAFAAFARIKELMPIQGYIDTQGRLVRFLTAHLDEKVTMEARRDLAIGAVGNLVGALRSAGRSATEWEALMQHLLAAVGAAPSQVST